MQKRYMDGSVARYLQEALQTGSRFTGGRFAVFDEYPAILRALQPTAECARKYLAPGRIIIDLEKYGTNRGQDWGVVERA